MGNSVSMTLEMSPAQDDKLHQLAELNGITLDKVLPKALTLYDIAPHAKVNNQRVGSVDANEHLLAEVIGA